MYPPQCSSKLDDDELLGLQQELMCGIKRK